MQFNSYLFILLFLPLTLLAYFGLNRMKKYNAAKLSLVVASLIFYGYNEITYVFVILSSILVNYLGCVMLRRFTWCRKIIVVVGVIANIALLGYFKYFDFLLENINALTGSEFSYLNLALPLGISFFTFQQLSYLIDAGRGKYASHSFLDYILFVTFFPSWLQVPSSPTTKCCPSLLPGKIRRWMRPISQWVFRRFPLVCSKR